MNAQERAVMNFALSALHLAANQNEHDMMMTGDELRQVRLAMHKIDSALAAPALPLAAPVIDANQIIGRLMSSDPDFDDCTAAAQLIQQMMEALDAKSAPIRDAEVDAALDALYMRNSPPKIAEMRRALEGFAAGRAAGVEPAMPCIGMRDGIYNDSTPLLSVGMSSFEGWYQAHPKACTGDKQLARDAYAAGMGDPLVTYVATQPPAPQ